MTKDTIKKGGFKILITALAVITGIYVVAFFYSKNLIQKTKSGQENKKIICVSNENKNNCFKVKIADTDKSRKKGLMFIKQLPKDEGMFFIYNKEGNYNFWMKNTLIPLDMIWINKDGKIIDIQTAQPCTTSPCPSYIPIGKAQYILEINAGLTKKLGIKTGSFIFPKKDLSNILG